MRCPTLVAATSISKYFAYFLHHLMKDGKMFIVKEVKEGLLKWFEDENLQRKCMIHIAMNLPALAISFLNTFVSLFKEQPKTKLKVIDQSRLPLVHVYAFSSAENQKNELKIECEKQLGKSLDIQIQFVRNVAPHKDMFRISIPLTLDILCDTLGQSEIVKRQKLC